MRLVKKIHKISDKTKQNETKYDFENASEHVIEWSRHNLRAARQDAEKRSIISEMDDDEAFSTFDWSQKVVPQEYREAQHNYYGKSGMSIFVGSFVWKDQQPVQATRVTTASLPPSAPTYSTASYIVTLNHSTQTELDSLSASEIIMKQFKADHPHIKKLHKRTDNARIFSSQSTPEVEKVICERVRFLVFDSHFPFYCIFCFTDWSSVIDS